MGSSNHDLQRGTTMKRLKSFIQWFKRNNLKIAIGLWCIITTFMVCQMNFKLTYQEQVIEELIDISNKQSDLIIYLMIINRLQIPQENNGKTDKRDSLVVYYSESRMDFLRLTYNNTETRMDFPHCLKTGEAF